ncbi:MAG: ABC transporter ATP-binding protein [Bacilli bacterium]|nr:ABC transporter ATP-binding protein [Bacilli bacterium]MBR6949636.1 ABC transporter ATP-binding protein [Bacilli bacterium]
MIRLFKNFEKKDLIIILTIIVLVAFSVFLDLRMPEYMSEITRLVQTETSTMNEILIAGAHMIICAVGSLVCTIVVGYFSSLLSARFSRSIRRKIFAKVESFGIAEIKKFSTSSLITRTTNDVTQVEMLLSMGLILLIKAPIMAVWALLKIIGKSGELSLVTGVGVILIVITNMFIIKTVSPRFAKIQKLTDKINGATRENITGIRVVHAFNAEKFEQKRFNDVNDELTGIHLKITKTFALMDPMMNFVMHFQHLGIYIVGAFLIVNSGMIDKINLFSNMVVFASYGMQVIISFLMLTMIFMVLPRAQVSANRINEVLDSEVSIHSGTFDGDTEDVGTVEFRDVSFKYPDADEYLLKHISFTANKGETVAFIGSTGSGKSTLINLVPRLYDATDGEVFVDGVNVKSYDIKALNNKIGYIPQTAVMFTGTVSENISYGDNGKEKPTLEKIKKAIEVAQGKDFVEKMDDKYEAHIARGGTNVSGGQKQRLSIARAIARDPEIYIFDDSFSALDYQTDAKLRRELKKYTKDATSLIVAQRIGTIMNADKIIVLDKGECVGIGTHKELLKSCKVYKEIALSQLSEEELQNA